MKRSQSEHLSDEQILRELDGELGSGEAREIHTHLHGCWQCRARREELEHAVTDFVRAYERNSPTPLPSTGPRALLKAQLSQLSRAEHPQFSWRRIWPGIAATIAAACLVIAGIALNSPQVLQHLRSRNMAAVYLPDSRLTPGATLLVNRSEVCAQVNQKNKTVPVALQKMVFEEYGLRGAEPRAYEVDYLVTPALGGADDIHNLWPHSYSAAVWNAQVKDALEDRLREMVCDGSLDLRQAQQEIATDWIGAYKKYFHTDQPLREHVGRRGE